MWNVFRGLMCVWRCFLLGVGCVVRAGSVMMFVCDFVLVLVGCVSWFVLLCCVSTARAVVPVFSSPGVGVLVVVLVVYFLLLLVVGVLLCFLLLCCDLCVDVFVDVVLFLVCFLCANVCVVCVL